MRSFAAGFRLQLREMFADAEYLMPLVTVPMFAVIFLAIVRHAGRDDLTAYALMAPVLIALWALSIYCSGEIVEGDKWYGVLEAAVAAPANLAVVVLGRICAVTAVALAAFAEVWLVGRLGFGLDVEVHHPGTLLATLGVTAFAMSGTAVIMAALFVLARNVRTFQNSLTYPAYVLGGVLVPVTFLPDWVEPLSKAVFLSWSADLLRASFAAAPVENVGGRLAAVALLGAGGFVLGWWLLGRILGHVRRDGSLGLA